MVSILYNNSLAIGMSWILSLGGLLGNIVVISSIIYNSKKASKITVCDVQKFKPNPIMRNRTFTALLFHLACSDFFGAMYLLIIASADLHYRYASFGQNNSRHDNVSDTSVFIYWYSHPFCYIARCCNIIATFQSIYLTTLIAIDRYYKITNPLSLKLKLSLKRILLLIMAGWVIAFTIAVIFSIYAYLTFPRYLTPYLYYHNLCGFDSVGVYYVRLSLFIISMAGSIFYLTILISYILTMYKLQQIRTSLVITRRNNLVERKLLYMAIFIGLTNFLLWFPAISTAIATFINYKGVLGNAVFLQFAASLFFLFQGNCVVNPLIYFFFVLKCQWFTCKTC